MPSILLIEDDDFPRDALATALTERGYTVTQAAPTDLVPTNFVMPNQEGLETITALRRDHPKLGIIAMPGGLAQRPPLTEARFRPLALFHWDESRI